MGGIMNEKFLQQFDEMLARRIGTLEDSLGDKLELLAEGQQLLFEKLEATRTELKADIAKVDHRLTVVEARHDQRIDGLEKKVDRIAADLSEHRRDTEAHRIGWRVREE